MGDQSTLWGVQIVLLIPNLMEKFQQKKKLKKRKSFSITFNFIIFVYFLMLMLPLFLLFLLLSWTTYHLGSSIIYNLINVFLPIPKKGRMN